MSLSRHPTYHFISNDDIQFFSRIVCIVWVYGVVASPQRAWRFIWRKSNLGICQDVEQDSVKGQLVEKEGVIGASWIPDARDLATLWTIQCRLRRVLGIPDSIPWMKLKDFYAHDQSKVSGNQYLKKPNSAHLTINMKERDPVIGRYTLTKILLVNHFDKEEKLRYTDSRAAVDAFLKWLKHDYTWSLSSLRPFVCWAPVFVFCRRRKTVPCRLNTIILETSKMTTQGVSSFWRGLNRIRFRCFRVASLCPLFSKKATRSRFWMETFCSQNQDVFTGHVYLPHDGNGVKG